MATEVMDERLRCLITKKQDPLSTRVLEDRLRESESGSECEQITLLLSVSHERRAFIVSEASFLVKYGFDSVGALTLAICRWERYGWRGIHSERARVQAARVNCSMQGLPV